MVPTDDYCELCDLPRSQCIHGRPAPEPTPAAPAARPRPKPNPKPRATPAARPVVRRWTPPEVLKPLIVEVLEQAGGGLDAEDALLELEVLLEDRLLAGDREKTPSGELRWHYAARRARMALVEEGVMTRTTPGRWQLG